MLFPVRTIALLLLATSVAQATTNDRWPRFSPDGRMLAFMSTRDGNQQVYVMSVDGSNVRRVTPGMAAPASYGSVSWSRDGRLLATVYRPTRSDDLDNGLNVIEFISLRTDGREQQILYAGINGERPDASPTNDAIVFEQEHGPFQNNPPIDIYVVRPWRLSAQSLTHGDGEYIQAAWSPDGQKIAYACAKPKQQLQICVMNADGSDARVITRGAGSHQWPAWAPEGERLAYFVETQQDRSVDSSIGTVDVDGSNERLITAHSGVRRDETPSWSPNGRTIAFQTDRLGNGFRIAVMNVDGSGVRMLTR